MGKPWENHGKTMGKPWENHETLPKIIQHVGVVVGSAGGVSGRQSHFGCQRLSWAVFLRPGDGMKSLEKMNEQMRLI